MQLVFTLVYVTNWIFGCFPPQGLFILLCKSLHQISIKRGKKTASTNKNYRIVVIILPSSPLAVFITKGFE